VLQIFSNDPYGESPDQADELLVSTAEREQNAESKNQVLFLRDIFGNPFRPIAIDPSWLTPTVKALAQKTYDNCNFDRLPLLADELVKSGCADEEILGHLRGPGPHVRGCWAVDLVLGKE
jgi:hypothetical protein